MTNKNLKIEIVNELEAVMTKMLKVQNAYITNTIQSYNKDGNLDWLIEEKIIQNDSRFDEIKQPLIDEFSTRFVEELFPIAEGNNPRIGSKIKGIKEFM